MNTRVHSEPATLLVPILQQLQQRLHSILQTSGNTDCTEANIRDVHGNSLTDLTFAVTEACSDSIPDDGLDDILLAQCETDELLLTCDSSSVVAVDSDEIELTCDGMGWMQC